MVGTFAVTKTWISGTSLTASDLNDAFGDVEKVVNETTTDNALWDATRQLVGTTVVTGGAVASMSLLNISVDMDDYDIEFVIQIARPDTNPNNNIFYLDFNDGSAVTVSLSTQAVDYVTIIGNAVLDTNNSPIIFASTVYTKGNTINTYGNNGSAITSNIISGVNLTVSQNTPIDNGSRLTVYKTRRGF